MKKIILSIITSACSLSINAQDSPLQPFKEALCIKKGEFIVDVYYGLPYVLGSYIKSTYLAVGTGTSSNQNTINSIKNINHIGGKFEYMVNENIGLGLEYTYAAVFADYNETYTVIENGLSVVKTGTYKASITKQRILARVNMHFATSDKLDPYFSLGLGYKRSTLKTSNERDAIGVAAFNASFSNLLPVSYRIGIGMRYFFTDNIGLNIEAGIGGPSVQGGISAKF